MLDLVDRAGADPGGNCKLVLTEAKLLTGRSHASANLIRLSLGAWTYLHYRAC
jgi:hypothetical protein